jgi:hypothetical protein
MTDWIPACAGMTGSLVLCAVFIYVKLNKNSPRKWDHIVVLSASRSIFDCWIPACAGTTA